MKHLVLLISLFLSLLILPSTSFAWDGFKKLGKGLESIGRGVRDTGKTVVSAVEYVGNKATGDEESAAKAKERMKANGHDAVFQLGKGTEKTVSGVMGALLDIVGLVFCPEEKIGTGYCIEGGVECEESADGTDCYVLDPQGNRSETPEARRLEIDWDAALKWVRDNEMQEFLKQSNPDLFDGTFKLIFPDHQSKQRFNLLARNINHIIYEQTEYGQGIPEGSANQQLTLGLINYLRDIEKIGAHKEMTEALISNGREPAGAIFITGIALLTAYSIYKDVSREPVGDEIQPSYLLEDIAGLAGLVGAGVKSIYSITSALKSVTKAKSITTPFGKAIQELSEEAIVARAKVLDGKFMYRLGKRGRSQTGSEAQFWSLEHPKTPGYAKKYGIPEENIKNADFIERATIKEGGDFVTRKAPGVGANSGGGIEIVTTKKGINIESHVSIE